MENAIKMIRWFIPKRSDIADYSEGYVGMVIDVLNQKPRKSLRYKTPLEVMRTQPFKNQLTYLRN